LKLEPDLDPEPEKLIEHGAQRFFWYFQITAFIQWDRSLCT